MTTKINLKVLHTILLLIAVCFIGIPAQAKYSGGTGDPNDPYQIATVEDLMLLGDNPEDYDQHFILTADIDLDPNLPGRKVFERAVIAPDINNKEDWFQGEYFTGVFDGDGHTISNLTIVGESYLGLFGYLRSRAIISNLGLERVDINGTGWYIGGLVGCNWECVIIESYSTGTMTGNNNTGGLVGFSRGNISTSYSTVTVTGGQCVGGLVGRQGLYSSIAASYSTGTVSGNEDVGGLVGKHGSYSSIATCYSTGAVTGESMVGGLVGHNWGNIITSYSAGTVSGENLVGGFTGFNRNESIITSSYSTSIVIGNNVAGGLVGDNRGNIGMCYSTGMVSGNTHVGGLMGRGNPDRVSRSFWDIQTSGQTISTGGIGLTTAEMQDMNTYLNSGWDLADEALNGTCYYWQISHGHYPQLFYHSGKSPVMPEGSGTAEQPYLIRDANDLGTVWFDPLAHYRLEAYVDLSGITWAMAVVPWFMGTIDGNGYVISNLHIQGSDQLGLLGRLDHEAIIYNLGMEAVDVNGTGHYIGGLVGCNSGGAITTSYSTGTMTGNEDVGGLVGLNEGSIDMSYSTGIVNGKYRVGGLAGHNWGSIITSYSAGTVTGESRVGGLVGYISKGGRTGGGSGRITASFWDIETSGQTTSAGGTGKTTAEMQTANTFIEAGWDFVDETANGMEDIWWILEGQDYPRLWWETAEQ